MGSRPCLGGSRPAAAHRPGDAALSRDEARTLCRGVERIVCHQPQSTAVPWPETTLGSVLQAKAFARHVGSQGPTVTDMPYPELGVLFCCTCSFVRSLLS